MDEAWPRQGDVLRNYSKQKLKQVIKNWKTGLFVLLVCASTFLANSTLRSVGRDSLNMWDLIYGMLVHPYYQLFLFLLFFLFVVRDICDDRPITQFILLRLKQKATWLWAKGLLVLIMSTLYTSVYLAIITVSAFLLYGYDVTWSAGAMAFAHGEFVDDIRPGAGFILIVIRHFLSIWFVSMCYLLVYSYAPRFRNITAGIVTLMLLIFNHLFAFGFFVKFAPFLYIHNQYIHVVRVDENGWQAAMLLNAAVLSSIIFIVLLLWWRKSKLQFTES